MFVSFHFSQYPQIYRALARRSPHRAVCSLIGEQTAEHREALRGLGAAFGFDIRFVQSGLSMIRTMRREIADGCAGLILLDIPWSAGKSRPDVRYPVGCGEFLGLSTVPRLLAAIDPTTEAVLCFRENGALRLVRRPLDGVPAAFAELGALIARDPADYERLHQMDRFFRFDAPAPHAVSFRVKDQRYALVAATMTALKLPSDERLDRLEEDGEGICADAAVLEPLARAADGRIDAVLCL